MNRTEWLRQMRIKAEALYDHGAPWYWVKYGFEKAGDNETHHEYLQRFLRLVAQPGYILSAACGADIMTASYQPQGTACLASTSLRGCWRGRGNISRSSASHNSTMKRSACKKWISTRCLMGQSPWTDGAYLP